MPNWRKLIQSGSDAELASLQVTNNAAVTGSFTVTNTASIDYLNVNDRLQGNGPGFQFFAYNEDTIKVKFANWYSSNDRQYGMGQLWYETWFAAIDNQAGRDNRRIGFYLEEPDAGSTDSGTPGQHPSNARFYVDINGGYLSGSLQVEDSISASSATVDNFTINNTLTAPTITGSLLRLSEDGSGLRLTNVGAFESSSGFHIFGNDNIRFSTNGSGGGNEALNLDKTTKKATFSGDVVTTALTASGLNYPSSDGTTDQVLSTDGNGNLSFNDISDLSVPSFLVFGQNDVLTGQTSPFEMKTTNGSQSTGWRMPVGGSVSHITLQFEVTSGGSAGRTITAELYKNNTATGKTLTVACSSNGITGGNGSITTETFNAGDRLTLYISHNNASLATGDHAGMLRILTSTA